MGWDLRTDPGAALAPLPDPQRDAHFGGAGPEEHEPEQAPRARLAAALVALLVAAAGTLLVIQTFQGVPPTPSGGPAANGGVAYVSGEAGDVYLTDASLSTTILVVQRHAAGNEGGVATAWAPDGTRVAFTDWTSGDSRHLYVMDSDGTDLVELSAGLVDADSPAWSPDGKKIAFTGVDSNHGYEIYVVGADGTGRSRLTDEADNGVDGAHMPAWSPDGTQIAYSANRYDEASQTESQAIFTTAADGSDRVQVSDGSAIDEDPMWSPDATKIAFSRKSGDDAEVFVANADGTDVLNISNHPALDWATSWSPDGTSILLVSKRTGNYDIYLAGVDRESVTRLTDHPSDDHSPVWSPDGTRIAFASDRAGSLDIYAMNTDGTGVTRMTDGPLDENSPAWLPRNETVTQAVNTTGSISAEGDPLPEGRLLVQLGDQVEVIEQGEARSSLVGDRMVALDLSPDGSRALVSTPYESQGADTPMLSVGLDTGDRTLIADVEGWSLPALWSPDGSRVAYRVSDRNILCIRDLAIAEPRCLPEIGRVLSFDWSPNGTQLVMDQPPTLTTMDAGSYQTQVMMLWDDPAVLDAVRRAGFSEPTSIQFEGPLWSPSGEHVAALAMVRTNEGHAGNVVLVFDLNGNVATRGAPFREFSQARDWTPAGDAFAYAAGEPPYRIVEARSLEPSTGAERLLLSTADEQLQTIQGLLWSPSGRWLALSLFPSEIRIIDVRGNEPPRVFRTTAEDVSELVGWEQ